MVRTTHAPSSTDPRLPIAVYDRPLTVQEQAEKARELLTEGIEGFDWVAAAEEELGMRRKGSLACEKAFHALVALLDAILQAEARPLPGSHRQRAEALEDVDRDDLARFYRVAKDVLYTEGYYEQSFGRSQQRILIEARQVIEQELRQLL